MGHQIGSRGFNELGGKFPKEAIILGFATRRNCQQYQGSDNYRSFICSTLSQSRLNTLDNCDTTAVRDIHRLVDYHIIQWSRGATNLQETSDMDGEPPQEEDFSQIPLVERSQHKVRYGIEEAPCEDYSS